MIRFREAANAYRETALNPSNNQYPGQSSNLDGSSTGFIKTGSTFSISEQLIPFNDPLLLRQMTRDMYFFDPIGGGITDIISSMPFGEYTLSGLPEKEMLEVFLSSMEKTRILDMMPSFGVDFLADGALLGIMNFDAKKKIFDSIMPHNLDYATITAVPIWGASALIDLKFPPNVLALFNSSDPRARAMIQTLPQGLQAQIKAGTIKLQPENTLYLPRRSMTHRIEGISMLTRLLPIFLLEKALLRGTIELAHRRQRGIMHIIAGDELWTPIMEELQGLADSVVKADTDPLGAVIATRSSVSISEISPGGAFWRYDESVEALTQMKMRGLGLSEDIFGSGTLAGSSDNSMTMFMREVENFRGILTRGIFYNKMFPYISIVNEFKNDGDYQEHGSSEHLRGIFTKNGNTYMREGVNNWAAIAGPQPNLTGGKIDISEYHIPKINWHISLKLDDMGVQLDRLQVLSDAGVPAPLRTLVGAAGLNITDLINGIDEDLELRKQIMSYAKQVNEMKQAAGIDPQAQDQDMSQERSSGRLGYLEKIIKADMQMNRPGGNRVGLMNRPWEQVQPYFEKRETGSHKYIRDKKTTRMEEERKNRRIAEQVVRLQEERIAKYKGRNKNL